MRALALDVGTKTIGLALSDPDGVIATPWDVVRRAGEAADVAEILRRTRAQSVGHLVVGLPLELDGRQGRRARLVRRFVEAIRGALRDADLGEVSIDEWDERFSTAAAERVMLEADATRAERKRRIDAVAAQFILQGWLDARRVSAVVP
jgi:putative Holliday junction resolvase